MHNTSLKSFRRKRALGCGLALSATTLAAALILHPASSSQTGEGGTRTALERAGEQTPDINVIDMTSDAGTTVTDNMSISNGDELHAAAGDTASGIIVLHKQPTVFAYSPGDGNPITAPEPIPRATDTGRPTEMESTVSPPPAAPTPNPGPDDSNAPLVAVVAAGILALVGGAFLLSQRSLRNKP
ncbi:hypothetical protein [Arthrobacter sp. M2012083]|uniref:hypothetical protein n=1 Tax=Arthrobacter sp. M2012083 TaxID=1197706 RepID=UPI0002D53B67|nr:hypothetical protein [Arthrobacter sp. M2012083]